MIRNYWGVTEVDIRDALAARCKQKTQRVVATELGVSAQYINDLVHGKRAIGDEIAAKLGYERRVIFVPKEAADDGR